MDFSSLPVVAALASDSAPAALVAAITFVAGMVTFIGGAANFRFGSRIALYVFPSFITLSVTFSWGIAAVLSRGMRLYDVAAIAGFVAAFATWSIASSLRDHWGAFSAR